MSPLRQVVVSSIITCSAVLALAWPTVTQATDPDDAAVPTAEETEDPDAAEVGPVRVSTRLEAHPRYPGMMNLVATYRNPSREQGCEADVQAVVYAQVFSEESRGGPMPSVAWSKGEHLKLAPAEVVTKTYTLPANLSFRVAQQQAAAKRAEETGLFPPRGTSFYASVETVVAEDEAPAEAAVAAAAPSPSTAPQGVAPEVVFGALPRATQARSANVGY